MNRPDTIRYQRGSAFSYTCHGCSRCCHDQVIQINPYEAARLADNRGIGTTEFLSRFTEANGTALKRVEQGACVFLTAQGCGVHQDRPLVCRLYPLGRRVTAEGRETFHELTPHPATEGEYGTRGTVEDFLAKQETAPFIDAVDRYVQLVGHMSAVLRVNIQNETGLNERVQDAVKGLIRGEPRDVWDWIDMDRVVRGHCDRHGLPVPSDVPSKMTIHIQAIEERLQDR